MLFTHQCLNFLICNHRDAISTWTAVMKSKCMSEASSQFLLFLHLALAFEDPLFVYFLTNRKLSQRPFKVFFIFSKVNSRTIHVTSVTLCLKWPFIFQELHEDNPSILPRFWSSSEYYWLWVFSSPVPVQGLWLWGERLCKPLAITSLASHLFLFRTYLLGYMYCVIEADFSVAVKLYNCILNLLNKMPPDIALGAHLAHMSEV